MLFQGDSVYYDRAFINNLYRSGYYLANDLIPLYRMVNQLTKYANLSKQARTRLKWFDYYYQCDNVAQTCRHFGIARKTFYKWLKVYEPDNLYSLEDRSRAPINTRQPEITPLQEQRVIELRKKYIRYSKIKLAKIYTLTYSEPISS